MTHYGKIESFDEEVDDWNEYIERMEQYFCANEVVDGDKQRAILLSVCGGKTYKLIRNLVAPAKPTEKTFEELKQCVQQHLLPKPSVIVQRFKFNSRYRQPHESISAYVAELRRLSEFCEYGTTLDEMLRDRLVCGVRDEATQKRLLGESELTFKRAFELAQSLELASKNVAVLQHDETKATGLLQPTNEQIHRLRPTTQRQYQEKTSNIATRQPSYKTDRPNGCSRCGGRHEAKVCPFRQAECFACRKKGHTAARCFTKPQMPVQKTQSIRHQAQAHQLEEEEYSDEGEVDVHTVQTVKTDRVKPVCVNVWLNNKPVSMEVDTGAAVTVLSEKTFKLINQGRHLLKLQKTKSKLRTYTGEQLSVLGEVVLKVQYDKQTADLVALVVPGKGPDLMGRTWLRQIRLNWGQILRLEKAGVQEQLTDVLQQFAEVFKEELGTMKGFKARIYINPEATPVFCKPRPVPYAMKEKIDKELERLEKEGTITRAMFSEWAAPIVPIVKPDGSLRICGDYKVTVNKVSKLDNYPIPKTEDLLAVMGGGLSFTKLDMSQAYQQLLLDDKSKEYVTINTHRGLYRYNRLPYGVSSAPGIFQRMLESLLRGIPKVIVRLDDILISGSTDEDHLKNLTEVLERLKNAGLRLNKKKCSFFKPEVVYCGNVVSSEGTRPLKSNVEAILNARAPLSVTELKGYLGMLNYYHRYLPCLSTSLAPLHDLLKKGSAWKWGDAQEKAFQQSKKLLTSTKLLVHYDDKKETILACDASPYGIGAVISHREEDGREQPIAYASRTLSSAERNYSQLEKESLAIIFGVRKFHQYLWGRKFVIQTDHKPLLGLLGEDKGIPQMAASRIQRWAIILAAYEYKLEHRPGTELAHADGLSRLPIPSSTRSDEQEIPVFHLEVPPVRASEIQRWTAKDPVLMRVLKWVQYGDWPPEGQGTPEVAQYVRRKLELWVQEGCLLWGHRVVVPKECQKKVLKELHETHPGICRMKALARSYVWWPGLDADIETIVHSCDVCQRQRNAPPEAPLHLWEHPRRPWSRIHVDYAGPFLNRMFLVVSDAYSKWLEVCPLSSSTAKVTIESMMKIFATHGLPEQCVTDNGPCFSSVEFKDFMESNGIKHSRVAPYHPASNGQAENAVQIFKNGMKKITEGTVEARVAKFLFHYRRTPHTTTGLSPAELLMGRKLYSRLDLLFPQIHKRVSEKQSDTKQRHDQHAQDRHFNTGDRVWANSFGHGSRWREATLLQPTGPVSWEIEWQDGSCAKRHQDHLRLRYGSDEENRTGGNTESVESQTRTVDQWVTLEEQLQQETDESHNNRTSVVMQNQTIPSVMSEVVQPDILSSQEAEHLRGEERRMEVTQPEETLIAVRPRRTVKKPEYLKDYVQKMTYTETV